jgi:hypothetical protein
MPCCRIGACRRQVVAGGGRYAFPPPQLYRALARKLLDTAHGKVLLVVFSQFQHVVQPHIWRALRQQVQQMVLLGPAVSVVHASGACRAYRATVPSQQAAA